MPTVPGTPGLTASTTPVDPDATTTTTIIPPTNDPNIPDFTTRPPNQPFLNVRKRRNAEDEQDIMQTRVFFSCFTIRVPGEVQCYMHLFQVKKFAMLFSYHPTVGTQGQSQVNRGCIANGGNTVQTCRRANQYTADPQECSICSSNECNRSDAGSIYASTFLIFTSLLIVAFKLF